MICKEMQACTCVLAHLGPCCCRCEWRASLQACGSIHDDVKSAGATNLLVQMYILLHIHAGTSVHASTEVRAGTSIMLVQRCMLVHKMHDVRDLHNTVSSPLVDVSRNQHKALQNIDTCCVRDTSMHLISCLCWTLSVLFLSRHLVLCNEP